MARAPQLDLCIFCEQLPCVCNKPAAQIKKQPRTKLVPVVKPVQPTQVKPETVNMVLPRPTRATMLAASVTLPGRAPRVDGPVVPAVDLSPVSGQDHTDAASADRSGDRSGAPSVTIQRDLDIEEAAILLLRNVLGAVPVGEVKTQDDPSFRTKLVRSQGEQEGGTAGTPSLLVSSVGRLSGDNTDQ